MQQRIAKAISSAGVCSRRQAEMLIQQGMVKVDNVVVTSPAINVGADNAITVNEQVIDRTSQPARLWIYYKPVSLLTTHHDPYNRATVFEQLVGLPRVISVGRLDLNSEGLLLLTNSGTLARSLELPATQIERVYKVRAYGDPDSFKSLCTPINIDNILYNPKSITVTHRGKSNSWFEVVLTEGKNREIRKIFEYYGLTVNRLIRVQYGPFKLGNLKVGQYQEQHIPQDFQLTLT